MHDDESSRLSSLDTDQLKRKVKAKFPEIKRFTIYDLYQYYFIVRLETKERPRGKRLCVGQTERLGGYLSGRRHVKMFPRHVKYFNLHGNYVDKLCSVGTNILH
jgi:hypothetical protein